MNWKLVVGRSWHAWLEYPDAYKKFRSFPTGRPIFITGTHRSGTTWTAAMLAEPGLWYVHEPFMPRKGLWHETFTYVDPLTSRPDVDALIDNVVRGKHRAASNNPNTDHPLMPLRLFKPPIQRVMIKDPIACLLTGYIAQHFDFDIIVLFRHPAGFAASVTRLGWPVGGFLKQFLQDGPLMDQHLASHAALLEKHQTRNDLEAAAVLHGALNTVLWRQIQKNITIQYHRFEDLCQEPIKQFRGLFESLDLPYNEDTYKRHVSLSENQSADVVDYRPHAVVRNSKAMAKAWINKIDEGATDRIRKIWSDFEVPLYREEIDWPSVPKASETRQSE